MAVFALDRSLFVVPVLMGTIGLSLPVSAQSPEWHHLQGGSIRGVFALDANNIWTAEDGGRIRYSDDGGDTWTFADVTDKIRTDLRGVFVWENPFTQARTGWAVGEEGVVVSSTDPTNPTVEWTWINEGNEVLDSLGNKALLYDIWMFDGSTGCLAGFDGVLHETGDGGANWTRWGTQPPVLWDVASTPDPWDLYSLYFWSPAEGIVAADNGAVFRFTTDSGPAWTIYWPISSGGCPAPAPGDNLEFYAVDVNPANPDEVWISGGIGTNKGYVYRSTNRGLQWQQERILLPPVSTFPDGQCGVPTLYGLAAFAGDKHALTGGYGDEVRRHLDLPMDLIPMSGGSPSNFPDPCSPTCAATQPYQYGMPVWQRFPTENDGQAPLIADIVRTTGNKAVMVGNFGRLRRTEDVTVPWNDPLVGWIEEGSTNGMRLAGGDFLLSGQGAVIGQGKQIRYTSDGGLTFTPCATCDPAVLDLSQWGNAIDLEPVSPSPLGVAVGDGGFIAYSQDGGASWNESSTTDTTRWTDVAFAPGTAVVFAVGDGGAVSTSTNGGIGWAPTSSPGPVDLHGVSFATAQVGFVVGADHAAWRTADGGMTWQSVRVNGGQTGNDLLDVQVWNGGASAIAVGEGGEVALFTGTAFQVQNPLGATEILNTVEVVGTGPEFWVGGNGGRVLHWDGAVWTSPKSQTTDPVVGLAFVSSTHGYAIARQFTLLEYQ